MNGGVQFAESLAGFEEFRADVERHLDTTVTLPDWPFRAAGFVVMYEYERVLGGSYGAVIEALVDQYGDEVVTVLGLYPAATYYARAYEFVPAFKLHCELVRDSAESFVDAYWAGVSHEPGGDPTGAITYTIDIIAIAGSSGAWAVWGQRDWEIGLLVTREREGRWRDVDVLWFGPEVDLDEVRGPPGWGMMPIDDRQRETFSRHVRTRGSGPDAAPG